MAWFCWKDGQSESIEISASTAENMNEQCDGRDEGEIPVDFPEIDHISLYTLRTYFILSFPLLLSAAYTLSYVFTAGTVNYRKTKTEQCRHPNTYLGDYTEKILWCLITECEDLEDTTLHPSWLPNAVPYSNDAPTTCTRYGVLNSTDSCATTEFAEEAQVCDAWVYDPEELTILNEWDLTCDNNLWKLAFPGTINNVGQLIGLIFSGYISDKYGRRMLLTVSTLMCSVFGSIRAFSVNYEMFVSLEFLDAVAAAPIYSAGFVLGMESVGPKKRVLISNVICCMYAVGEVILALCAMWLRSWRYIILALYVPGLLVIFLPCFVSESVRWLLSKGRVTEAETLLRKIAAENGIEVSDKSIKLIRDSGKTIQKKQEELGYQGISPVRQVVGNRTILIRLVICALCWITSTFVYYGLSLSSVNVAGNKYINFILVALVEIPGQFASWILVEYAGRKPTLSGSFLLSGVFCILTIFVPEDWWYLTLIVFLGGKLCITIAFSAIYVYTAEMFPTPIRHSLLGFCSMTARIGSIIAPQMPLLAVYMTSLPSLLFGIVAIITSILSLNFPETMGIKLPDTMDEAMNIGKVEKAAKLVA